MQTILVAGAGKSTSYLIHYLLTNALRNKWKVIIADANINSIIEKIKDNTCGEAVELDITNNSKREALVKQADIVLSLLPPHLHILLAKDCLKFKKHLITSSYISEEIKEMDEAAKEAGIMFMCEMGLDPGIDHMTATKTIHSIQRVAGVLTGFKSYCGGLIAPNYDDNPWHYKFTWNPKNVVVAGMDGAKYLLNNKPVEIGYTKLFDNCKKIKIGELGYYAYYPNRDAFRYLDLYEVPEIKTFMRATLRNPIFTKGWHALVLLGLTSKDDIINTKGLTIATWVRQKTNCPPDLSITRHVANLLNLPEDDRVIYMIQWLGLFNELPLKSGQFSSADILLEILLEKFEMRANDKDLVIMQHEFEYLHKGEKIKFTSTMAVVGENKEYSAMAKTVGLPIGVLAKLILHKKIVPPAGVNIPNLPSIYRPVLIELAHYGIVFKDELE